MKSKGFKTQQAAHAFRDRIADALEAMGAEHVGRAEPAPGLQQAGLSVVLNGEEFWIEIDCTRLRSRRRPRLRVVK